MIGCNHFRFQLLIYQIKYFNCNGFMKFFENRENKLRPPGDIVKWLLRRDRKKWPTFRTTQICVPNLHEKNLTVTMVNHSTVLLQGGGQNVLTDPIFSDRASPFSWFGPKRVHPPGINLENLPPLDAILVSHNHYDHMDVPTLKKLDSPLFLSGLGNATYMPVPTKELDWWESYENFTYVPAEHFSARGLFDRNRALWGGFLMKLGEDLIYFAGDTGYGSHFKEIKKRYGSPKLALLPIGAYEPRWFMQPVHMNPEEALKAHDDLGAETSVGIHWGTFQLTDEGLYDPVDELNRLKLPQQNFIILNPGETLRL